MELITGRGGSLESMGKSSLKGYCYADDYYSGKQYKEHLQIEAIIPASYTCREMSTLKMTEPVSLVGAFLAQKTVDRMRL
jgi:hypothetical protein